MADINTLPYREKTAKNLVDLNLKDPFPKNDYNEQILEDASFLTATFPDAVYEGSTSSTLWSLFVEQPDGTIERRPFFVKRSAGVPVIFL